MSDYGLTIEEQTVLMGVYYMGDPHDTWKIYAESIAQAQRKKLLEWLGTDCDEAFHGMPEAWPAGVRKVPRWKCLECRDALLKEHGVE